MGLSPWPAEAAEIRIATATLKAAIGGPAADARIAAWGGAAAAMVQNYAPGAPDALRDEAVIRFAGYLAESSRYGAIRASTVGPASTEYVTNHAAMFRNSGAAALLTRWRIRRGGAIAGRTE